MESEQFDLLILKPASSDIDGIETGARHDAKINVAHFLDLLFRGILYLLGRVRYQPMRNSSLGNLKKEEEDETHRDKYDEPQRHRIGTEQCSESGFAVLVGTGFRSWEERHVEVTRNKSVFIPLAEWVNAARRSI